MSDLNSKKTELQKEFEAQTPTIKGIYGNEYNLVYCSWLEFQVKKLKNEFKKRN